jgi:hypothetical protein
MVLAFGHQYPVLTGALKNFAVVQMNPKRWLDAL